MTFLRLNPLTSAKTSSPEKAREKNLNRRAMVEVEIEDVEVLTGKEEAESLMIEAVEVVAVVATTADTMASKRGSILNLRSERSLSLILSRELKLMNLKSSLPNKPKKQLRKPNLIRTQCSKSD